MTEAADTTLFFDKQGSASLDGQWEFFPSDHERDVLDRLTPELIGVPGLGQVGGEVRHERVAWYRRRFDLDLDGVDGAGGYWTLRIGTITDLAEVYLNGEHVGSHDQPFMPLELVVTGRVRAVGNVLDVRVTYPPVAEPLSRRVAPGNQSVTLHRHGPVVLRDVFVNSDAHDLTVQLELDNVSDGEVSAVVGVRTLGEVREHVARVPAHSTARVTSAFGATAATRWSPEHPALHEVSVVVTTEGKLSARRRARYGVRTIRLDGTRLLVNDEPYRMKGVLVQGVRAHSLSAAWTHEQIVEEVLATKAMGFNTLRLPVEAFGCGYLDVCDELGVFVVCDLPVAEPIRRARNHPSILMWSVMNGNAWVEPDPYPGFEPPIITATWPSGLQRDRLDLLEEACREWSGCGRPLFVTEFGDCGLPAMPELSGLAAASWPASVGRFAREAERCLGISGRLQIEVLRRHDDLGGYCLVLDVQPPPKSLLMAEVQRANQQLLPMLRLDSLVVAAGEQVRATVHIANDGRRQADHEIDVRFGGETTALRVAQVDAHHARSVGEVTVRAPDVTGSHDLVVTLRAAGNVVAENRYPMHVVTAAPITADVQVVGPAVAAVRSVGARVGDAGPLVVAEDHLDATVTAAVRRHLDTGGTALVLAQPGDAGEHYPVPVQIADVETAWGSSLFHFTTDSGAIPSLPRRNVLVAEESTVQARSVIVKIGDAGFPDEPVVIAYEPVPGSITGWIVGAHRVGSGRLICCQYRLTRRVQEGDVAARALLRDLIAWAVDPRPPTTRRGTFRDDGRALTYYSYPADPDAEGS